MIDIAALKALFENGDVPDADDFADLIESSFNANGGWVEVPAGTASYSSGTRILFTDADVFIAVGDQIRYKQGAGYKFGKVLAVTSTYIDLDGDAVANAGISDFAFSKGGGIGFPEALKPLADWMALLGRYANTETLTGDKTLVDADNPIQYLDPTAGEYTVELPAEGERNHIFYFVNTSASYDLQVDDDSETTIVTVEPGKAAMVLSDGSSWSLVANTNATVLNETGGPTMLSIGAIADGGFLKRSGTSIVGDADVAQKEQTRSASLSVFDLASEEAIATGDTKARLPIPKNMAGWDLTKVEAVCDSCTTKIEIQINNGTNDMLSTKLSIDSGDTHSKDATTAAVINSSYDTMAEGMILDVDVDSGAGEGLAIMFTFTGDMD